MTEHNLPQLAELAYHTTPSPPPGYTQILQVHAQFDTEALHLYHKQSDTYFVAFTGTDSILDLALDLFAKTVTPKRYHAGFLLAWKALETSTLRALHRTSAASLHFVGHSLGGAVASIAYLQLHSTYPNLCCTTFGAPKITKNKLTAPRITQVRNMFDPVPYLPPGKAWKHPNTSTTNYFYDLKHPHKINTYIRNYTHEH